MSEALYRQVLRSGVPLIDVRAEIEFSRGAFPAAVNMPILNDAEREQVGTCYRRHGQAAAEALGHRLVSGTLKQERIEKWLVFLRKNPTAHLYCFRGGQRSALAAAWLAEAGARVPRIPGGYKALRRFLLDSTENLPDVVVLAGRTGSGKTAALGRLAASHPRHVLDLERLANHRGSAFGKRLSPQPTQVNFEHALAITLLDARGHLVVEDESKLIGHLLVPPPLQARMTRAPVLLLQAALARRVENIRNEYVIDLLQELRATLSDDDEAQQRHRRLLRDSLDAIRKRLGGANHAAIGKQMDTAFKAQAQGDFLAHDTWIANLLQTYYDPMYDYQLAQRSGQIVFGGGADEICEYASALLDRQDAMA